jgi:anti-sigma28 factor (negative regulator of flagellin synthesis)
MTEINPIGRTAPTTVTSSARPAGDAADTSAPAPTRGSDKAEFSPVAKYLSMLQAMPAVRQDLVHTVKGQIANGTYETPQKIDGAIDNLAEDLNSQG